MFRIRPGCLLCIGLIFFGLAGASPGSFLLAQDSETPIGEFFQIKAEPLGEKTRVIVKVKHSVRHTIFSLNNPDRVVINLTPCLLKLDHLPEIKIGPIQRLRCSQFDEKTVRLVFDLKQKVPYTVSIPEGELFQLWFDLEDKVKKPRILESTQTSRNSVPIARSGKVEARETKGTVKKPSRPASEAERAAGTVTPKPTSKAALPEPLLETGRALLEQKKYAQGREELFHYLNVIPPEKLDLRVVEEIYHSYRLEGNAPSG